MKKELKTLIGWLERLGEKPRKTTAISFWGKGFSVFIDHRPVLFRDDEFHHFTIISNKKKSIKIIEIEER